MKKIAFLSLLRPVMFTTIPLVPLTAAISCGSSESTTETKKPDELTFPAGTLGLLKNTPISLTELNEMASKIPGENDVPWRRGVSYEAGSQAFSIVRNLAYELGWTEKSFATTRKDLASPYITTRVGQNKVLITDADLNKTVTEINTASQVVVGTDQASIDRNRNLIENFKKIKAKTQIKTSNKLAAYLAVGDDTFSSPPSKNPSGEESLDMNPDIALLDATGFTPISYKKIYYVAWNNYKTPGDLTIQLTTPEVSRIVNVPGGNSTYPIIDQMVYQNEFAPLIKELFKVFLKNPIAPLGFAFGLLPEETINLIKYIQEFPPSDARLDEIIAKFNNGSHHMLALSGIYRGFDASFVDPASPLTFLSKTGDNWPVGSSVTGFAKSKLLLTATGFIHFNTEAQQSKYGYFTDNPTFQAPHLAYFTNKPTLDSQLTANGLQFVAYRALYGIKVDATSKSNAIRWLNTSANYQGISVKFTTTATTDASSPTLVGTPELITTVSTTPSERNFYALITFPDNSTYLLDLTASSGIRALANI